jgi:hypothetical protein
MHIHCCTTDPLGYASRHILQSGSKSRTLCHCPPHCIRAQFSFISFLRTFTKLPCCRHGSSPPAAADVNSSTMCSTAAQCWSDHLQLFIDQHRNMQQQLYNQCSNRKASAVLATQLLVPLSPVAGGAATQRAWCARMRPDPSGAPSSLLNRQRGLEARWPK